MPDENDPSANNGAVDALSGLSRREIECLALVHAGLESKEIAPLLGIVPGTVDLTLKRATRRTGIAGRKQLARVLAERQPDVIQSVIQRLGQPQKTLAGVGIGPPDQPVAAVPELLTPTWWWPVPTTERQWNDLSAWQKRLWALAIALGFGATATLLVGFSEHVLVRVGH